MAEKTPQNELYKSSEGRLTIVKMFLKGKVKGWKYLLVFFYPNFSASNLKAKGAEIELAWWESSRIWCKLFDKSAQNTAQDNDGWQTVDSASNGSTFFWIHRRQVSSHRIRHQLEGQKQCAAATNQGENIEMREIGWALKRYMS